MKLKIYDNSLVFGPGGDDWLKQLQSFFSDLKLGWYMGLYWRFEALLRLLEEALIFVAGTVMDTFKIRVIVS